VAVVRFTVDVMVDDQPTRNIDDALQIVRGKLRRVGISHRLGLRFAKHEYLLIPSLEFLLSSGQPILPTREGGNGGLEAFAVQRLIFKPLRDGLVDDVQAVEIIGDLLFGMRDVPCKPLRPGDVLRTGDGLHLGAGERDRLAAH